MRQLSRITIGALATTLVNAVCVAAAPAAAPAADGDIPILGQALSTGGVESGDPGVITVHGVRRTPTATVVYWSVAIPENAPDNQNHAGFYMTGTSDHIFAPNASATGDVALIDQRGALLYLPLKPGLAGYQCVCPRWNDAVFYKPGQAGVFFTGISPVPAGVNVVDVAVGDQFIANVPVEDGLMEPTATGDKGPWILGTGWPLIDPQLLSTATALKPLPVTQRVTDLANTITTSKGAVSLNANVLFAPDSATLNAKAGTALTNAVTQIKASGAKKLIVTGHTDSDNTDAYNLTLSKQRADAVTARLKVLLGTGYDLTAVGKGESEPIADNTTESGKAANRRVTITFTGGS